jgi:hypothetical protein
LADSVEKVLSGVGPSFQELLVRLAILDVGDRFNGANSTSGLRRCLKRHRQPNSAISSLLREFCRGDIFDFFNTPSGHTPNR